MPKMRGLNEGGVLTTVGMNTGTTAPTSVTAGASNAKGSYAQIISSTADDANGFYVWIATGTSSAQFLVDIAIGGAGSEQVIVSNIPVCARGNFYQVVYCPIFIPKGTRVAARAQRDLSGTSTITVAVVLLNLGFGQHGIFSRGVAYGANTGTSTGTSIDPGGSANTKGSYAQLDAAIANPIRALSVIWGAQANSARVDASWLVDIAVGAAAAETVVLGNIPMFCDDISDCIMPLATMTFPVNIPAGVRLSARAQSSSTDAAGRVFDLAVIGFD